MDLFSCPHCQAHNDSANADVNGHLKCMQCGGLMSVPVPVQPPPTARPSRVVNEPPPLPRDPAPVSRARSQFACPFCGSNRPPLRTEQISTGGWITFGVLLAFCWPLFWIGLLIKETRNVCGDCGVKLD